MYIHRTTYEIEKPNYAAQHMKNEYLIILHYMWKPNLQIVGTVY